MTRFGKGTRLLLGPQAHSGEGFTGLDNFGWGKRPWMATWLAWVFTGAGGAAFLSNAVALVLEKDRGFGKRGSFDGKGGAKKQVHFWGKEGVVSVAFGGSILVADGGCRARDWGWGGGGKQLKGVFRVKPGVLRGRGLESQLLERG